MTKNKGLSLLELLIIIAILTIISFYALPFFHQLQANRESKNTNHLLTIYIQKSKTDALLLQKNVTLCPTADGLTCSSNWNQGFMSFVDTNKNRQREKSERILHQVEYALKYGSLQWRGTLGIQSLTFQSDTGLPRGSNGSFYYCTHILPLSFQLKLSAMGHSSFASIDNC